MKNQQYSPIVPFGAGIAATGLAIWALVKLWPLVLIGGGLVLAYKGLDDDEEKESNE